MFFFSYSLPTCPLPSLPHTLAVHLCMAALAHHLSLRKDTHTQTPSYRSRVCPFLRGALLRNRFRSSGNAPRRTSPKTAGCCCVSGHVTNNAATTLQPRLMRCWCVSAAPYTCRPLADPSTPQPTSTQLAAAGVDAASRAACCTVAQLQPPPTPIGCGTFVIFYRHQIGGMLKYFNNYSICFCRLLAFFTASSLVRHTRRKVSLSRTCSAISTAFDPKYRLARRQKQQHHPPPGPISTTLIDRARGQTAMDERGGGQHYCYKYQQQPVLDLGCP